MRTAVVGILMALGAALLLSLAESFNSGAPGSLVAIQVILLACIPISLMFFVFLSHQEQEQQARKQKESPFDAGESSQP